MSGKQCKSKGRIAGWIIAIFGGAALSVWLDLHWFRDWFLNPWFHIISFLIGWYLMQLVRRGARNTGRFLSQNGREGDIPRFETNRLVKTGIYACMRHPMHLALLLWPWSFAFLLGSPSFILIIAPLEMLLMLVLIKTVEEPGAIHKFGDAYREYMKEVPWFNFKPECLRQLFAK